MRNLTTFLPLKLKFQRFNANWWNYRNAEKKLNFQKFKLKWKIWKHFRRPKQQAVLTKLFISSEDKKFLSFWNKIFLRIYTGMYRDLLSKCFENAVLWRLEMVQCKYFFWHQPETCLLANLSSEYSFWLLLEYIFCNVEWLDARKISAIFWANSIVKWVICFTNFCRLRDFLLQNLKLKDKIQIWGFESFIC